MAILSEDWFNYFRSYPCGTEASGIANTFLKTACRADEKVFFPLMPQPFNSLWRSAVSDQLMSFLTERSGVQESLKN
jgi:hypothetical protein